MLHVSCRVICGLLTISATKRNCPVDCYSVSVFIDPSSFICNPLSVNCVLLQKATARVGLIELIRITSQPVVCTCAGFGDQQRARLGLYIIIILMTVNKVRLDICLYQT